MSMNGVPHSDIAARIAALGDEDLELPIVDAHHHLWDLSGPIGYPWVEEPEWAFLGDYSTLKRNYLPPEYRRDSALHNVVATVHVEAEARRTDQVAETEWLTRQNAEFGMPNAIVAHAWVDTPDAEDILLKHKQFPLVKGIRTKPVTSSGPGQSVRGEARTMQDPRWLAGLGLLQKYDLSWDLRVPWWHLEEAAEVARAYPNLPIALNHAGYPWDRSEEALGIWRKGMVMLAQSPNVVCKISNFCVPGLTWDVIENTKLIRECIEMFGVDRCMFASNYPVDRLKASWDFLFTSYKNAVRDFSYGDTKKMFCDTAARFYRLDIEFA
jgi:predicted TIM-barrel fold metal-dependent hydrolase